MRLKSFESMLITFEVYEFFIMNWESEESFANKTVTSPALSLEPMIGV